LNIDIALWSCVEDALQSLGMSTMNAVVLQINKMNVDTTPDKFDINRFSLALESLFGEGSEAIMDRIYKNLCKRLEVVVVPDPALPVIERINKILEPKKMSH
jgi:hypothetical protein